MPGELIFNGITLTISLTPGFGLRRVIKQPPPTFDRVHRTSSVCCAVLEIAILGEPLPLQFLPEALLLGLMVSAPPEPLIMIEYNGAYCLFGAILANDVIINTALQIARVELRNAKGRFGEDGTASCFLRRIVARGKPRVEVLGAARSSGERGRVRKIANSVSGKQFRRRIQNGPRPR